MIMGHNSTSPLIVGAAVTTLGLLAAFAIVAAGGSSSDRVATALDVEALARMIASENPKGSIRLWVEQCWTQLRSRRRGQSIYDRITGGAGWGKQGGKRPVASENPASTEHMMIARLVLLGSELSEWTTTRKFFEPRQQDLAFAEAEAARAKKARGETLTPKELRILGYKHDADGIRRLWIAEGSRHVGTIEGVEFWT